jgi:nitroreductase/NAD-dependent dihydropyrimidine dehydrogenase PreA subunit
MFQKVTTTIDPDLCTGCGMCVDVCPVGTLALRDGTAAVVGDYSLNCGHCMAICPTAAVKVGAIDESMTQFSSFQADNRWLPYGTHDTAQLVRLMASRRSCRHFLDKPVSPDVLDDLVKIGCTAPSATNCQMWTFTVLPDRNAVLSLGKSLRDFYVNLNRLAAKSWLRNLMALVGKRELQTYFRNYYDFVNEALVEFERSGRDRLFYGAPAAVVVGCTRGASLPKEDTLLASQNILLAAHSMGLGSCLIGMAVEAMKNDRSIQRSMGIPEKETVYAVIALGYPDESYARLAGRKKAVIRVWQDRTTT